MKPEQLPSIQIDTRREFYTRIHSVFSAHFSLEVFDLSRYILNDSEDMNHLAEAFNSRLKATEQLVSAFISICGKGTSGFQQEDLLLKYHAAQSEVRPYTFYPEGSTFSFNLSRRKAFTPNWPCYDPNSWKPRHRRNGTSTTSCWPSHASTGSAARRFSLWHPLRKSTGKPSNKTSPIQKSRARNRPLLQ